MSTAFKQLILSSITSITPAHDYKVGSEVLYGFHESALDFFVVFFLNVKLPNITRPDGHFKVRATLN